MKNIPIVLLLSLLPAVLYAKKTDSSKITVAAYYFPNYHTDDARNIQNKGAGWSEWELVKAAQPRFPGHDQPKVPLWGYTDEKVPKVMEQKIKAASDYGIDCFKPNYWKIDGKPYFSVYDIQKFIEGFGSIEETKAAMERLNKKAIAAGLKGIHWNMVAWGRPILPVEKVSANVPDLMKLLGFDSATSYVWIHHATLPDRQTDYNLVRDQYMNHWDKAKLEYPIPYFPNVSMGWDSSPRCDLKSEWGNYGYPFMNIIGNNTPENFKKALQMTKDKLLADPNGPRILNINCWNEWTEGSYLEPDTKNKFGYLEAVKNVFKK